MSQSQTGALTPSIAERPVRLGGQECDQIDQLLIIVFSFFCGACFMWLVLVRTIVRQRDGLAGSPLYDCCVSYWCWSCGLCQLARHEGLVTGNYGGVLSPTGEKRANSAERIGILPI